MNIKKECKILMKELKLDNLEEVIEEYIEYEKIKDNYDYQGYRFQINGRWAYSGGIDIQHAQLRLILRHARALGLIQ